MLWCVDIDQTISTGYRGANVAESIAYYRNRGILVPETLTRYLDFFQLPEVLRIHEEIPGAQAGVQTLAGSAREGGYFTVRKSDDPQERACIEQATHEWLREHHFPSAERVTFCQSMAQKLLAIAELLPQTGERVLLIDDSWHKVLHALSLLEHYDAETAQASRRLSEQLILIAFGTPQEHLPSPAAIRMLAMPDWSGIETLLTVLTKEDTFHAVSRNS
jgi:hypothetical protein